ncbi:BQ5605_C006g04262 [Microbotryum silenes-dioicae]|uniref:BQ5605_C006g04262 protein n=1 Tax=Microbotryum silenes-dioicae TaxID=796604 RepID=A0A2X0P8S6_9BASI|nr:BQ5605_C006g04262 [Microbotryum silenes-dioicae]
MAQYALCTFHRTGPPRPATITDLQLSFPHNLLWGPLSLPTKHLW